MTDEGVSQTALGMAMSRARHRRLASTKIIDDPVAEIFPGVARHVQWVLESGGATSTGLAPVMPLARARFFEDITVDAVKNGVTQVVIIGAGLDTLAYRHADALSPATIFELDKPQTQSWKRRALEAAGMHPPSNLRYVPADLAQRGFPARLQGAGFASDLPAVVGWLGVTYYLHLQSVVMTLEQLGAFAPSTRLVMDYFRPRDCWDDGMINGAENARQRGEPWITTLTDNEVDALLGDYGFSVVEWFTSDDALRRYRLTSRSSPTGRPHWCTLAWVERKPESVALVVDLAVADAVFAGVIAACGRAEGEGGSEQEGEQLLQKVHTCSLPTLKAQEPTRFDGAPEGYDDAA